MLGDTRGAPLDVGTVGARPSMHTRHHQAAAATAQHRSSRVCGVEQFKTCSGPNGVLRNTSVYVTAHVRSCVVGRVCGWLGLAHLPVSLFARCTVESTCSHRCDHRFDVHLNWRTETKSTLAYAIRTSKLSPQMTSPVEPGYRWVVGCVSLQQADFFFYFC